MSDETPCIQKIQEIRANSAGYFVRKSEEMMRILEKENFNLKLKIYFLENKYGIKKKSAEIPFEETTIDVLHENELLRTELNEKNEIMSNALKCIEDLEKQKGDQINLTQKLINDHQKRINALKVQLKKFKGKGSKKQASIPVIKNYQRLQRVRTYKYLNSSLSTRMNDLKNDCFDKNSEIDKLSTENFKLSGKLSKTERNLDEKDNTINLLTDRVKERPLTAESLENSGDSKTTLKELELKCLKLERENDDYRKIIKEQSEIMKALNRSIEAKSDLHGNKIDIRFNNRTSFIQNSKINLNNDDSEEDSEYYRILPFHNPIFGSFQSLHKNNANSYR